MGFCARQTPAPQFCVDFDEGKTLGMLPFDLIEGSTGTATAPTILLDLSGGSSPPASILFEVPATAPGVKLFVDHTMGSTPKGFVCAFDVKLDTAKPTYLGSLIWIELSGNLTINLGENLSVDDTAGNIGTVAYTPPGMSWTRLAIRVDVTAARIALYQDGIFAGVVMSSIANSLSPRVHFGTLYPNGSAFTMRYDTLVCDKL